MERLHLGVSGGFAVFGGVGCYPGGNIFGTRLRILTVLNLFIIL